MTESMINRVYVKALEKATAALENGHGRGFPASQCRHFLKRLLQSDRPIFGNLMGADRQDLAAFLDAPAYENQNPNKEYAEGCETSTPGQINAGASRRVGRLRNQYAWTKISASTSTLGLKSTQVRAAESGDCMDAESNIGRIDRG